MGAAVLTACGGNVVIDPASGGSGSIGGATTAATTAGAGATSSSSPIPCVKCNALFQGASPGSLCAGASASLYMSMKACVCSNSDSIGCLDLAPCSNSQGDLCAGATVSASCKACLDATNQGNACVQEIHACEADE
jgi:hypothetical protein